MPADPAARSAWLAALEARAPDLVAPFAVLAAGRPRELRRGTDTARLSPAAARSPATFANPEADRP